MTGGGDAPGKDESSDKVEILAEEAESDGIQKTGTKNEPPHSLKETPQDPSPQDRWKGRSASEDQGEDGASGELALSSSGKGWIKQNQYDAKPRPRSVFLTREQAHRSSSSNSIPVRPSLEQEDPVDDKSRATKPGPFQTRRFAPAPPSSSSSSTAIKSQAFSSSSPHDFLGPSQRQPADRVNYYKNQSEPTWVIQGKAAGFANFSSLHALVPFSFFRPPILPSFLLFFLLFLVILMVFRFFVCWDVCVVRKGVQDDRQVGAGEEDRDANTT